MSLYNMVNGFNVLAGALMAELKIGPADCGRFRDCYLVDGETGIEIAILTRCGGGNRDDYPSVFEFMTQHPNYLREADDEFDSTYCRFFFKLPDGIKEEVKALVAEAEKQGKRDAVVNNDNMGDTVQKMLARVGTPRMKS